MGSPFTEVKRKVYIGTTEIRGQGTEIREQGSGIRDQGSGIRD
jgi:hypothetical protein